MAASKNLRLADLIKNAHVLNLRLADLTKNAFDRKF